MRLFTVAVVAQGFGVSALLTGLDDWHVLNGLSRWLEMAGNMLFLGLVWSGFGFLFSQIFPRHLRLRVGYVVVTILSLVLAAIGYLAER